MAPTLVTNNPGVVRRFAARSGPDGVTPEAEWVFLEVNPGGQFGFLEDHTDAPLTATLADLLTQQAP